MKYFKYLFLLFIVSCFSCVKPPNIHIGHTYFETQKISLQHANALDAVTKNDILDFSGVYWYHLFAIQKYPALIKLNEQNHMHYVLLSDSLAAQPGDFLRLTGTPFDTVSSLGHSYTKNVSLLRVNKFNIEKDTHIVLRRAHKDYLSHKNELQQQAKQPGSKLIWPNEPEWQLFVDKARSKVIVYFTHADLMYALDVTFVYDLDSYDIEDIYAREWFKGE